MIDPAIYDAEGPDANPVGLMGSERDGGYAEYVIAPVSHAHDVTDSPVTDAELAALPTAYGTALGMIQRGRVREGETVLVTGASGAWVWAPYSSPEHTAGGFSRSAAAPSSIPCARREPTG